MSLRKKHFLKVAEILNQMANNTNTRLFGQYDKATVKEVIKVITMDLSDYFATENAQFDRQRFKEAVLRGVEE